MTYPHPNDPFDVADNPPPPPPPVFYGQVQMDVWFCKLVKGQGKVPFNPNTDRIEERRTAVKVMLLPLPEQNVTFDVSREYVAEFGPWPKITLPSIKNLGLSARELDGRWVKLEQVPEGRTYVNQNGETKESTTFKFLAVYPDEAACRTAYLQDSISGPEPAPATNQAVTPVTPPAAPVQPPNNNSSNKERETALKFLELAVKQANGDPVVAAEKIQAWPLVVKYFPPDSPETLKVISDFAFDQFVAVGA